MGEGGTGGGADTGDINSRSPSPRPSDLATQPAKREGEDIVMTGSDSDQTRSEGGEGGMTKAKTNGAEAASEVKEDGDITPAQLADPPVDPELVKQGLSEQGSKESVGGVAADPMDMGGSETVGDTAASLVSLAGGAVSYLSAAQSAGNGTGWGPHGLLPSSPESPNKRFGLSSSPLPSMMMGQGSSSPTAIRDGKHTTLPPINSIADVPLNSIDVLAELATKQESPQQGGWKTGSVARTAFPQVQANLQISPSNRPPATAPSPGLPTPVSSEGTPRPNLQHMSVQQRQHVIMAPNETYYPHQQPHYPPIKDASASPRSGYAAQPATPTSDNANLFARSGFAGPGAEGRRVSNSSEFQYNSDQATPQGPSTGETMGSAASEDTIPQQAQQHRQQQSPPVGAPRNSSARGSSGPMVAGGFKCEFENCRAAPFQTQYLLK